MYSVLKAPENVGKSRMVRSVRSKCIGIKNHIENYDEVKLINSLERGFQMSLGIELEGGTYTDEEKNLAETLVKEKYSNINWLQKYD
jgi:lipoate-protein ligase A